MRKNREDRGEGEEEEEEADVYVCGRDSLFLNWVHDIAIRCPKSYHTICSIQKGCYSFKSRKIAARVPDPEKRSLSHSAKPSIPTSGLILVLYFWACGGTAPSEGTSPFSMLWKSRISEYIITFQVSTGRSASLNLLEQKRSDEEEIVDVSLVPTSPML